MIEVQATTSAELKVLHGYYCELAELAKKDSSLARSHSIEEAVAQHNKKSAK